MNNQLLWQFKQWFKLQSIKQHLLFWLLLFLIPVLLIITFRSYFSIQYFTNQANDQSLFKVALAIANDIKVNNAGQISLKPTVLDNYKRFLHSERLTYLVIDHRQQKMLGESQLPLPALMPAVDDKLFYSREVFDQDYRLVAFNYPLGKSNVTIIVAETFKLRNQMHEDIVLVFLSTTLIIILLVVMALNLSIKRGLSSLTLLKDEILARHPTDTDPLDFQTAPKELHPLVMAMNDLFIRVKLIVDEKENFIANASHQLKTPLAGLKLQVENAQRESTLSRTQQALTQLKVSIDKLTRLNSQLLNLAIVDFSRKASSDNASNTQHLDLVKLVQTVSAEWVPSALNQNMDLGFSCQLKNLRIDGKALLIKELLNNLLDNAIAYNQAGTIITVSLTQTDAYAILTVEDDGIGVDLREQNKVFQRFYRPLGNSHTQGCGLGMAIVKEVTEQHGGYVELAFSDAKKQCGTKVSCYFPK